MNRKQLIEIFDESNFVFKAIYNLSDNPFEWLTEDDATNLDIDYLLSHSGQKTSASFGCAKEQTCKMACNAPQSEHPSPQGNPHDDNGPLFPEHNDGHIQQPFVYYPKSHIFRCQSMTGYNG